MSNNSPMIRLMGVNDGEAIIGTERDIGLICTVTIEHTIIFS